MPKKAPTDAAAEKAGRDVMMLHLAPEARDRLAALCHAKAREYAAQGLRRLPVRLQSEVINGLIFQAFRALERAGD